MTRILTLLLAGLAATALGQSTLSNGLKACYSLNANANDPISNLNGVVGAVTPATDRNNVSNACYSFANNINSIITLPDDPRLKGQVMTVSAWAYPTSGAGSYVVFAKNNYSNYHEAYCLSIDYYNSVFDAAKINSNGHFYAQWSSNVVLNTWYHLVITVDAANVSLYVNGVLRSSVAAPGPIDYEAGKNVRIGGSAESYFPAPFSGKIDNVRFYDRILTATEISQLYTLDPPCVQGDSPNSIEAFSNNAGMTAYPNPTNGVMRFTDVLEDVKLVLFDVLGAKITEQTLSAGKPELDINYLPAGIYYAELWQNNKRFNLKIVKE